MVSESLKSEIENYYQRMRTESPMFSKAAEGRITADAIRTYLNSVLYLIQHTPIHLREAHEIAQKRNLTKLRDYFANKLEEEKGHDEWAKSDISAVERKFSVEGQSGAEPTMRRLVHYVKELIETDPSLYLSYILFAEYFTVLIAPEWLRNLETKCGIPASMLSVIGNHAELDKSHVAEGLKEIDLILGSGADPRPHVEALRNAMNLYVDFCDRIGGLSA